MASVHQVVPDKWPTRKELWVIQLCGTAKIIAEAFELIPFFSKIVKYNIWAPFKDLRGKHFIKHSLGESLVGRFSAQKNVSLGTLNIAFTSEVP